VSDVYCSGWCGLDPDWSPVYVSICMASGEGAVCDV
jgi:hypothetical protein